MPEASVCIRKARERCGLTVYQVHCVTKIPYYLIERYERGQTSPGMKNLVKLADLYRCSIDELIGRVFSGAEKGEAAC